MKKIITICSIFTAAILHSHAQSLLSKVPSTATLVLKYSGDNLSKKVPVKKLDSYNFVKNNLFKMLKADSITSLESTGINFEQDAYQYVSMGDSSVNFATLFALKNVQQFLQLVQANYQAEMRPEKKNGFEWLAISKEVFVGWNDKQAILLYAGYQNTKSYYDYAYPAQVDSVAMAIDTVAMAMDAAAMEAEQAAKEAEEAAKESKKNAPQSKGKKSKSTQSKKGGSKKTGAKKAPPKKGKTKVTPPVIVDEEVMPSENTDAIKDNGDNNYYYDTTGQAAREAWEKEQNQFIAARQNKLADSIFQEFFNGNAASIETETSYAKVIEPGANVSAWVNYDNLLFHYWKYLFGMNRGFYPGKFFDMEGKNFNGNENNGFRTGMSIFFDNDKMRVEQKMYAPEEKLNLLGKEMYNSKQSNALAGYVSPGNIGYISASINSEAMAHYYYKLIRQYLNSAPFTSEHSDAVDIYIDLLEIIIDEKSVAELMPGNMMIVLHDMKTQTVSYTDYVYDDNFKSTEVKKTKEELSPNFTFVMETKKEAFLKKVAKLPLRYAKKSPASPTADSSYTGAGSDNYNYQEKGGYYQLVFEEGKSPISSLYFVVKDGKAVITTSKEVVDMTLNGTGYTLDAATSNSILNNNMSLRINTQKLIQQISPQLSSDASKKISKYFEENMGDVKMEGGLKNGMMSATTTMNISGNNSNSLEFFFNMIDAINNIMEKDKEERNKKID